MATRNLGWWLGGVVAVILISAGIWNSAVRPSANRAEEYVSPETDNTSGVGLPKNADEADDVLVTSPAALSPTKSAPTPAKPKPAVKPSDAYQIAINTYKYRIQFVNCRGVIAPGVGTLSLKKNVKFMLDNRDKKAHVIAFAGQSHTVAGENFYIASIAKPGSYNLTCDGGGSAKLNIED